VVAAAVTPIVESHFVTLWQTALGRFFRFFSRATHASQSKHGRSHYQFSEFVIHILVVNKEDFLTSAR
jgi:hypothetical protein